MSNLRQGVEDMYHHVRFATHTVGPTRLPPFAYTCVEVSFDTISYVAVLRAADSTEAEEHVKEFWPDAKVYRVVRNQMFLYEDYTTNIMRMGFVDKSPMAKNSKPGVFRRLFRLKKGDRE